MTITPQGQLYLCKTKLENDYKNQLTFTNLTAQMTYFNSTIQHTFDNYTYIKKDNVVQVGKNIDEIIDCNYLFYKNTGFTTKYYFCFITNMEYVNENCTRITFETDCFQTWMFQIEYKQTFVEREHVNDDTVGLHTVPEQLETGDYIVQVPSNPIGENDSLNYLNDSLYPVIGTSDTGLQVAHVTPEYNGIFGGVYYLTFPTFADARAYINYIQGQFASDPIVTMFMCPKALTAVSSSGPTWLTYTDGGTSFQYAFVEPTSTPKLLMESSISKPSSIDGYTPRNNKLLTYPYQFLDISNNGGSSNIYCYELFKGLGTSTSNTCDFRVMGSIGTGCSIQVIPRNYNKTSQSGWNYAFDNYEESIDAPKLPTCSWINDAYTNWLTQNAVNIGVGFVENAIAIGTGRIGTGLAGIAGSVGEIYAHSKVPTSAKGGVNQGDLLYSSKRCFSIYKKCIKNEYARIIDSYFDFYGYKVNQVKTPNITGRTNWNYVKTINCNFDGDIPQTDLNIIKQMFNNGVTLWHNPSTMLNYSNSNTIVS